MRLLIALLLALALSIGAARAEPSPAVPATGWLEQTLAQIEAEAAADIDAAPAVPMALTREWRSFDRAGSGAGALLAFIWVALATAIALLAETAVARPIRRYARHRAEASESGPRLADLLTMLAADLAGLAAFVVVYGLERRSWLITADVTDNLALFAINVLIRWRVAALVIRAVLRPREPIGRLIETTDGEARSLSRFLSLAILTIILLIGFGRVALMDEDSGAAHLIGLLNALLVCGIYVAIVFRARGATEALIRGRRRHGVIAAARAGLARAWLPFALMLIAGLLVFFVAGLSLGMLSYYHAVTSTLGVLFVVLVIERLTERVWHDEADDEDGPATVGVGQLQARAGHHIARAVGGVIAAMALAWIWIAATGHADASETPMFRSSAAAIGTLFIAFVAWELVRLAIDRHLLDAGNGPSLPGTGDDEESSPASRLQTILPLVRAAFAVVIGVLTALIVLSRLGVDTAPLIAGAGVFGLAVSFGSQSLVRDIISGLFYMWDDAFRVGEYIDTGRLKGTVETLGIRSVKLRHQNGPLHTIPYGQLGSVSNLSRDYATIKFNLRLEPGTDIELVRKTTKQLGLAMQEDNPELAGEIILPLKLQGVAEIADNALVMRFKFTARPVKPSWVQREYLKRIVTVFSEKDIKFARGAMMIQTVPPIDAQIEPASTAPPARTARRSRRSAKPPSEPAVAAAAK